MTEKRDRNETVNQPPQLSYPFPYNYPCDDDEIDLYEIWLILVKRKKIIGLTTLVFLLIAVLYLVLTPPKYKSNTTYGIPTVNGKHIISPSTLAQAVGNLATALKNKDYNLLSQYLNLPIENVKNISSLSVKTIDTKDSEPLINLSIEVTDRNLIKTVAEAIKEYLNNVPAVKEAVSSQKQLLATKIQAMTKQLSELEKLKKELLSKLESASDLQIQNLILAQISQISNQILKILSNLELTKTKLLQLKGVEILVPPILPNKPFSPKIGLIFIFSIASGLIFGVFLAIFAEWLQKAREKHKNSFS